jgi:hydroxyethylthiazole kinase-like uncharacterized protein yjeF
VRPLRELLDAHRLPDLSGGKDESGTLLIIGGPPTCPGAVLLGGLAALRVGSGRVQLVVDAAVAPAAAVARPEALVVGWDQRGRVPDAVAALVDSAAAVVIGPGHRDMEAETVAELAGRARGPVVLDAGALPAAVELAVASDVVIAPNTAEARPLVGREREDAGVEAEGEEAGLAAALQARLDRPVAVRGPVSVVASGRGCWCYDAPPPGLGTPGSGDVLVGVLGALLAAGMPAEGALGWAVQLHASAGRLLAEGTPVGYLAGDIADTLPHALAEHRAEGS